MAKKFTYEYVKEQIENEGYKLLSKEYKDNHTKLNIECIKGHKYDVVWNSFQSGSRCPVCSGNKKLTYSYVKKQIESEGYTLISKEYKNARTKLDMICPEGHECSPTWDNFINKGKRCFTCLASPVNTINYVKEQIEKEGYTLLSKKYKNTKGYLKIKCPKGHEYKVKWNNFQQGKRCPICFKNDLISKAEKEILKYVKNITNENIISNDRTQIMNPLTGKNLELDIWIPTLKKAIEYNGTYWHSDDYTKIKDKIKKYQCKNKGINLMVVDEQDWLDDKNIILNNVRRFVNG